MTSAAPRTSAKILTIGNSFADDATGYLVPLARSAGKEAKLFCANIGGYSLEQHVGHLRAFEADSKDPQGSPYLNLRDPRDGRRRNFSLPEALSADSWDFVTVQQVSTQSFVPESYRPHVDTLFSAIRRHAPQAEILVHQTWSYREDHPFFASGEFTSAAMFRRAAAAYRQLAREFGFRIVPVGAAFQAARETARWTFRADPHFNYANPPEGALPDQTKSLNVGWQWERDAATGRMNLTLDATHANPAGRFLGSAVFYLTLFNEREVLDRFVPTSLAAEDAASLRTVAQKICAEEIEIYRPA